MSDKKSEFHKGNKDEIREGDWVNSYRGPGQILSVKNGAAKVKLISASSAIVSVPVAEIDKITRVEALKIMRTLPDTKKEIYKMSQEMETIIDFAVDEDDFGNDVFVGNLENLIFYLEDFLVELIDLKNKDPYTPYYPESGKFTAEIANLCYIILDHVGKSMEISDDMQELARLKKAQIRVEKIQDKFFEITE